MRYFLLLFLGIVILTGCKKKVDKGPGNGGGPILSSAKEITSFTFTSANNAGLTKDVTGVIKGDTIYATIRYGTDLTKLIATVVHTGKSINPDPSIARDYSALTHFTVTAEDASTKEYVIKIVVNVQSTIYTASINGTLYALDGEDGSLVWSYKTNGEILSASPAYKDGIIFIGSANNMYAIDAVTGNLKWTFYSPGKLSNTTPVVSGDTLYFGGGNTMDILGVLYAVNANTGTPIWQTFPYYKPGNVTVYDGQIFAGSLGGFHTYDAMTGQDLHRFDGSICQGNPLVVNGIAFEGTEATIVSAFDVATGDTLWEYVDRSFGFPYFGSPTGPTIHNGTVFNASYLNYMYAFDSATGSLKWKFLSTNDFGSTAAAFSSPTVANGMVYAGNSDYYFYAIDETTGALRWKFMYANHFSSSANNCTVNGDAVYLGSSDGKVFSLNALTGSLNWSYTADGEIDGGPLVITDDHKIYYPGLSGEHQ
jgi:eukaryotic-like serine/threonine-protein kinase